MISNLRAVICAGAATVFIAGCGTAASSTSAPAGTSAPAAAGAGTVVTGVKTTTIVDATTALTFSKPALTVPVGTTVEWINTATAGINHNVTFSDGPTSPTLDPSQTFEVTFTSKGTFSYICTFHTAENMKGTVTVG